MKVSAAARKAAVLTAVAIGGLAAPAPDASAGVDNYCARTYPAYDSCVGPRHSLNANVVQSGEVPRRVCAGARDGYTNAFYGEYLCGEGYRCHPYGGSLLYPVAHNGVNMGGVFVQGWSWYGSDHYTGSCG